MVRFIVVPYTMLSRARWPDTSRLPYHRKLLHVRDSMFGSRSAGPSILARRISPAQPGPHAAQQVSDLGHMQCPAEEEVQEQPAAAAQHDCHQSIRRAG